MHPPNLSKTLGQYFEEEIQTKLGAILSQVSRVDIVFDVYNARTIKSQTREYKGKGKRVSVRKETPIVKNFRDFMKNDDNKTELFNMTADAVTNFNSETLVIATQNENVKSNQSIESLRLDKCNQEEAETRIFNHVIVTVDTNVVAFYFGIMGRS